MNNELNIVNLWKGKNKFENKQSIIKYLTVVEQMLLANFLMKCMKHNERGTFHSR